MADIDYETEYNNRARVPEHPEIFARWAREAEHYRADALKSRPRRARPVLWRYAAAIPRSVSAGGRRVGAARDVRPWRLVALARSVDVQPDGARPERARRRRCGRGLRSLSERHASPTSSSKSAAPACFCGSGSAGACWSTDIRPAAISPPRWSATDWPSLYPEGAGRSGAGRLFDLRRVRSHAARRHQREPGFAARCREGAPRLAACSGRLRSGRIFDAVVGGLESSEFKRQSRLIAADLAAGRCADALRGNCRHQSLHRHRRARRSAKRDDRARRRNWRSGSSVVSRDRRGARVSSTQVDAAKIKAKPTRSAAVGRSPRIRIEATTPITGTAEHAERRRRGGQSPNDREPQAIGDAVGRECRSSAVASSASGVRAARNAAVPSKISMHAPMTTNAIVTCQLATAIGSASIRAHFR